MTKMKPPKSVAKLTWSNAELRLRLEEAEETLRAIRAGEGDPLAMDNLRNMAGICEIMRDTSQCRRTEEEIRRLNQNLEQRVVERTAQMEAANQEMEAFSYCVSHDLRAPLRHIWGFADLLARAEGTRLPEKSRRYLEEILNSAKRMGSLIDDLLLFSRLGRGELHLEEVDLAETVHEAKKQLESESHGRDIRWKQGVLPKLPGDRALLTQVMLNLLSNALTYTRPRKSAEIEIGCDDSSPAETVVSVRDNGMGFDMQYKDKLFGVFQRLHSDKDFEGTGIGLANVRRIIARHGGRTWAEGKLNQGATFYFSLPKSSQPTLGRGP